MLSKELEVTLNNAFRDARDKRHEFMTVEHLLLALLDNEDAGKVLKACGVQVAKLRTELEGFLEETTPVLSDKDERETQPTLGFQRVLQRAVFHVQSSGKKEVTGAKLIKERTEQGEYDDVGGGDTQRNAIHTLGCCREEVGDTTCADTTPCQNARQERADKWIHQECTGDRSKYQTDAAAGCLQHEQ